MGMGGGREMTWPRRAGAVGVGLALGLALGVVPGVVPGLPGGGLAAAASSRAISASPAELQRELDQLRVTYKDDHPDVIRARRALEKALEKRRKAAEAAAPYPAAPGEKDAAGAAGVQPR